MIENTITAEPISGVNPVTITVESTQHIPQGAEEKRFVRGRLLSRSLESENSKPVSLVKRTFVSKKAKDHYIETWEAFRNIGLPVVPSLRDGGSNSLLLTDVTADGSRLYGKHLLAALDNNTVDISQGYLHDEFLALTEIKDEVQLEVNRLTNLANSHNVELPYDDPFELRISPDGSWSLIILDLRYGNAHGADFNISRKPKLVEYNVRKARNFMTTLSYIKGFFERMKSRDSLKKRFSRWL